MFLQLSRRFLNHSRSPLFFTSLDPKCNVNDKITINVDEKKMLFSHTDKYDIKSCENEFWGSHEFWSEKKKN